MEVCLLNFRRYVEESKGAKSSRMLCAIHFLRICLQFDSSELISASFFLPHFRHFWTVLHGWKALTCIRPMLYSIRPLSSHRSARMSHHYTPQRPRATYAVLLYRYRRVLIRGNHFLKA